MIMEFHDSCINIWEQIRTPLSASNCPSTISHN
uniref:Uncharacterized protein n=1 Tax=Rhizophora mucronata TaxID=61149 RepID=A0A2P2P0D4_RHIMU